MIYWDAGERLWAVDWSVFIRRSQHIQNTVGTILFTLLQTGFKREQTNNTAYMITQFPAEAADRTDRSLALHAGPCMRLFAQYTYIFSYMKII